MLIPNLKLSALLLCIVWVVAASITPVSAQAAQESEKKTVNTEVNLVRPPLKNKIITVKYRDLKDLYGVIRLLGSESPGASISYNEQFRTFTIRDFPENIATIEEAIQRLDTPEAPRPDIEFRIHILMATNDLMKNNAEFPPELNEVLKSLQSTLNYKNYSLLASTFQRTKEGGAGVNNKGVADPKMFGLDLPAGNQLFFEYSLQPISLDTSGGNNKPGVQIGTFNFGMQVPINMGSGIQYSRIGFNTPINVRDGEKVVVGTTTVGDKGLIVVLSAKVVK